MNIGLKSAIRIMSFAGILAAMPAAQAQSPKAFTQSAGPVRASTATLNGMAVPGSIVTAAWFEWGLDRNYGSVTDPQSIGPTIHVVRITAPLTNLSLGGVYHFRLVASNSFGITRGFDSMFTTSMKIQTWGSFSQGPPILPPGLTNLTGIACGHKHGLAIRNDGTVAAWNVGYPFYGFWAHGQTNVPAGLSNIVALAGGFSHSLALKEDGTVVAWGTYGDNHPSTVPQGLTNVIAMAGGDDHSVALKANGDLVVWGDNVYPGATNDPNLHDIVAIACGTGHSLALGADGIVHVWGGDLSGTAAPSGAGFVAVATMGYWNLALKTNGTVVEFGVPLDSSVPKPASLSNVVALVSGYSYAEVLKADGTLIGYGRGLDATNIPPTLSNVVAFASGDYHRVGLAPTDLAPFGFTLTASGPANQPLTISLSATDLNADPVSFQINTLPTNGVLYQYAPNGLGPVINAPGTAVSDASRVIFVPAIDGSGNPYDSFSYLASDGFLNSTSLLCNVVISPAPLVLKATLQQGPPLALVLNFPGWVSSNYSVWGSTDLKNWNYLGTPNQSSNGQYFFFDYSFTNSSVGFYRVQSP